MRFLVALNMFILHLVTGQADLCRKAFVWEINESYKTVNTYRKYL